MESIKLAYEELSRFKQFQYSLSLPRAENILRQLKDDDKLELSRKDKLSKGEEYLAGAKRIKKFDLEIGSIVETRKHYVYGYQDLSCEEFESYIFWRTQIRQRKTVVVPGGFLALYLIELVNFIEIEDFCKVLEIIEYLEQLSGESENNLRQIKNARREFVFYYGSKKDAEELIDADEYTYFLEDEKILCHQQTSLLTLLCKRHYSGFLRSKLFLEHKNDLEEDFQRFFCRLVEFFSANGIELLEKYYGKIAFSKMRNVYLKSIDPVKIVKKEIVLSGICILKVNDSVQIATKYYTDGTYNNKAFLYVRDVVMRYILRLYEHKMRMIFRYPKTFPTTEELQKGFYKTEIAQQIINVIDSDEFEEFFYSCRA